MEDSLIAINVVVGDRTYRIRIEPHHEEIVRKIVKTINDKLIEFKTIFAGKDMQDYIAMVILWYATSAAEEGANGVGSDVGARLKSLEAMIDKALG
jgi:cell division protein ZapA